MIVIPVRLNSLVGRVQAFRSQGPGIDFGSVHENFVVNACCATISA